MARHNNLGTWGENVASEYLVTQGFAIVDKNVRMGHNELDIVAMKGDEIVFVEIKTRADDYVDPISAIDRNKIRRLCKAAEAYVVTYAIPHSVRFDVITIIGTPERGYKLEHYPDAFVPPLKRV